MPRRVLRSLRGADFSQADSEWRGPVKQSVLAFKDPARELAQRLRQGYMAGSK